VIDKSFAHFAVNCRRALKSAAILLFTALGSLTGNVSHSQEVGPLKVSATGRYLINRDKGEPFLVLGDTGWSLIAQAREQDIEKYLDDRQKRGFNSIIVNLIEHKFSDAPPKNRSGLAPFSKAGDLSTPNSDYFDFAAKVIESANHRGIVVWLAPAYLGYAGGDEGFFREIKAGGREKLKAYGDFVGRRFRDMPNIVWILGGDYTPEPMDRWTITDLGRSIWQQDTNHLMIVHAAPETSATVLFGSEEWLALGSVYSYDKALFGPVLAEYARRPLRPFVLLESTYESEHNSTPSQIRRQAYWTVLGGGCGHFFGNNPIWHFDGPGLFPINLTWLEALDGTGSRDMARLRKCFLALPWSKLRPEENHAIITDGFGQDNATCLTAVTPDGYCSVSYIPSTGTEAKELTANAAAFPHAINARWYNPTTGNSSEVPGSPFANRGLQHLRTPGDNGARDNDWVLILRAE
jgi:hypothetical protein